MKANELRIGNWVLDRNDFGMMVVSIDSYDLLLNFPENEGDPFDALIDEIKPIPLTEEWLLRFGFEFTDWLGSWDLKDGTFGLVKTHNNTFVLETHSRSPEIKFVHSLQNIYFCLTNKELNEKN